MATKHNPHNNIDNSIIEIRQGKEWYCNACSHHIDEKETVNIIRVGQNGHSMEIVMCDACLHRFSDLLWTYLSQHTK